MASKKNTNKKDVAKARRSRREPYLDGDVMPYDLITGFRSTILGDALDDIAAIWGLDRARIGSVQAFFDREGCFTIFFQERGPYMLPYRSIKGSKLKKIPINGHLPVHALGESVHAHVAKAMLTLPKEVEVEDSRWGDILSILKDMRKNPQGK